MASRQSRDRYTTDDPVNKMPTASSKTVGPAARKRLQNLIKYYMSKPHPFDSCVKDNTKRFGAEGAKRVCATLKDIGEGTTKWRKGGKTSAEFDVDAMVDSVYAAADGNIDGLVEMLRDDLMASIQVGAGPELVTSALEVLQNSKPQLTTVPNVDIISTGIEYPLASGPTTFTPEDLADAVAAQDDPCIPKPRLWLGHTDDKRIHGDRTTGIPSGEPAVGKVTNMRLEHDGHKIVGDLQGVPVWLANIFETAYPSRSIEGRFNFKTPSGKKWRLVISELALLGVKWPGVTSLNDIASLFTPDGPEGVVVTEASEEQPVAATVDRSQRQVSAQVTVEDLRRAWYGEAQNDPTKKFWWIRTIYVDPNELICDDDQGNLYRVDFTINKDQVSFGDPKQVKIQYVNASHGGIELGDPINEGRTHIARFDSRADSRPEAALTGSLEVKLQTERTSKAPAKEQSLTIKIGA